MNFFDANTWAGRWPFSFAEAHTPRSLAAHQRRHGIARALVSPFDAVFAPAPQPANLALLAATRRQRSLLPVPVINPALAGWRDDLAEVAADRRVRAVRLLPNYHDYRLDAPAVDALIGELQRRRLRLVIQMQLIDHRHEYHALSIKPVPADDLAALLRRHRRVPVGVVGGIVPMEDAESAVAQACFAQGEHQGLAGKSSCITRGQPHCHDPLRQRDVRHIQCRLCQSRHCRLRWPRRRSQRRNDTG